jgi:hypothetical protein
VSNRNLAVVKAQLESRQRGIPMRVAGIASRLRHHGYKVVTEPEGFLIQDNGEGPLKTGEQVRARAWGAGLVRMAPVRASNQRTGRVPASRVRTPTLTDVRRS